MLGSRIAVVEVVGRARVVPAETESNANKFLRLLDQPVLDEAEWDFLHYFTRTMHPVLLQVLLARRSPHERPVFSLPKGERVVHLHRFNPRRDGEPSVEPEHLPTVDEVDD